MHKCWYHLNNSCESSATNTVLGTRKNERGKLAIGVKLQQYTDLSPHPQTPRVWDI